MASPGIPPSSELDIPSSPTSQGTFRTGDTSGTRRVNADSSPLDFLSSGASTPRVAPLERSRLQTRRQPNTHRGELPSQTLSVLSSDPLSSPVPYESSERQGDLAITGQQRIIWGTNVSIQDTIACFKMFLNGFTNAHRARMDGLPLEAGADPHEQVYRTMLNSMRALGVSNLNLDARNLLAFPPAQKLYLQLIQYPQEIIPIMDQEVKEMMVALATSDADFDPEELELIEARTYKVRPYGLDDKTGLRELNPGDIDKLVSVKGLVLRASAIIPDMKQGFFRCCVCNHTVVVELDRGTIAEPTRCPRAQCGQLNAMQLVHNRCLFSDKQVVRLQETPDVIPDGQTPHSVSVCVYDELVDYCKAGDRVVVTGVFRSVPVRVNPVQRAVKSLYKTYVDAVHIRKVDTKRLGPDASTAVQHQVARDQARQQSSLDELRALSAEDVARVRETAKRPDVYALLARSLAPSVYEQDDVKKGILLQLFGGTNKTFETGGAPRYRGDINILLCGDPSTSKSQILQYVHKIAPRGIYTSGKGSSAVGLTAYVTRDPDTRQLVLESGALVLSDGGVCCIDEFDKMTDGTRSILHEVMEQQTVSIAKAGIITTLNARTSILASANPIGSRYNPKISVTANIDLPPTLLSRFDLVYLMIDKIDPELDTKLARHITSMYLEDRPDTVATEEILPTEFLTMYITYAKTHVFPVITSAAKDRLVEAYVSMRQLGDDARTSEKRITATTRQLESMIRLSEAHAKMRLAERVEVSDVDEAVRLIRSAMKDYAIDPLTGQIDMGLINTGLSQAQRELQNKYRQQALQLLDKRQLQYDQLVAAIVDNDRSSNADEVRGALSVLMSQGDIVVEERGTPEQRVRLVRRAG